MSRSSPPLLQLADGRRARPRKAPVIRPKELQLHLAVADTLRRFVRPDWRWTHPASGEHRDIRTAAKLKAMGVAAGWPDILLVSPAGVLHGLELKRIGEDLTDEQRGFQTWAAEHAIPFAVAKTIEEALAVFAAWGCLRLSMRTQITAEGSTR